MCFNDFIIKIVDEETPVSFLYWRGKRQLLSTPEEDQINRSKRRNLRKKNGIWEKGFHCWFQTESPEQTNRTFHTTVGRSWIKLNRVSNVFAKEEIKEQNHRLVMSHYLNENSWYTYTYSSVSIYMLQCPFQPHIPIMFIENLNETENQIPSSSSLPNLKLFSINIQYSLVSHNLKTIN